ncbi:MAG: PCYCGC motif-containing (lipo)protein [Methanosarcinales archaeon]
MQKEKIIGLVIIIAFVAVVAYFFISSETKTEQIPSYVTGEMRAMYEWAKTTEGSVLLEQIPCYCGCKYEGHKHTRYCFWRDDGTFDKHGITCSVCLDIAKKTKQMYEQGKDICDIRNEIDSFYAPNAELGTKTPIPEGCEV